MIVRDPEAARAEARCPVCARPWLEHDATCPRHPWSPLLPPEPVPDDLRRVDDAAAARSELAGTVTREWLAPP